jgi:hypothetical protein
MAHNADSDWALIHMDPQKFKESLVIHDVMDKRNLLLIKTSARPDLIWIKFIWNVRADQQGRKQKAEGNNTAMASINPHEWLMMRFAA